MGERCDVRGRAKGQGWLGVCLCGCEVQAACGRPFCPGETLPSAGSDFRPGPASVLHATGSATRCGPSMQHPPYAATCRACSTQRPNCVRCTARLLVQLITPLTRDLTQVRDPAQEQNSHLLLLHRDLVVWLILPPAHAPPGTSPRTPMISRHMVRACLLLHRSLLVQLVAPPADAPICT